MMLEIFFFFSSRRRHTRYWRDWSSDVCSSDLTTTASGTSGGVAVADGAVGALVAVGWAVATGGCAGAAAVAGGTAAGVAGGIGRASGRERVEISAVAVSLKKKKMISTSYVYRS